MEVRYVLRGQPADGDKSSLRVTEKENVFNNYSHIPILLDM